MPRLLMFADAGCHTGFATVSHNIGDRLVDMGWDVHVLAINYRGDYWPTKMKLYPASMLEENDVLGASRVVEMLAKVMPDVVLFVNDPQVVLAMIYDNRWDTEFVLSRGLKMGDVVWKLPIFAYMPIDGYDSPRLWDMMAPRVNRIAMSKFGQRTMTEAPVVWHGVDTSLYHPRDKAEAKRELGFDPDRFLILRVDKNSIRKDYAATWKSLRPILRKYADIDVHFHCQPHSRDGLDLNSIRFNDEDIRDRVRFPNVGGHEGWAEDQMALLYAAADLYVSHSWGEGFGLGNLYAIASGTPVIAQNCSAITEVVGPGGLLIDPIGRISTPYGQDQCLPDIPAFTNAIDGLYHGKKWRRDLAKAGVQHAQQFSWDYAAEKISDLMLREVTGAVSEQQRPAEVSP